MFFKSDLVKRKWQVNISLICSLFSNLFLDDLDLTLSYKRKKLRYFCLSFKIVPEAGPKGAS